MFDRITPNVKKLLIVNIVIFLMMSISKSTEYFFIKNFSLFNPLLPNNESILNPYFKFWQIFTYMFLHGGWTHLFSNMFGLFIFGSTLETFMGSKKFLTYYLLTGIGAALINIGIDYLQMTNMLVDSMEYSNMVTTPMLGASGAIFGILVAFGVLFPNVELMLLFFPFPIKAKYFVTLYGLYEIFAGTAGLQQGIAHFAHVGGLITGFILLKFFGFDRRFNGNYRNW